MTSTHGRGASAATGAATTRKFSAASLVRSRNVPVWCSTLYSIPWERGSTTSAAPSGRSAAMAQISEVTR